MTITPEELRALGQRWNISWRDEGVGVALLKAADEIEALNKDLHSLRWFTVHNEACAFTKSDEEPNPCDCGLWRILEKRKLL